MAHHGESPSMVVQVSCCLLPYLKGNTQLPQVPLDGDDVEPVDGLKLLDNVGQEGS